MPDLVVWQQRVNINWYVRKRAERYKFGSKLLMPDLAGLASRGKY